MTFFVGITVTFFFGITVIFVSPGDELAHKTEQRLLVSATNLGVKATEKLLRFERLYEFLELFGVSFNGFLRAG